MTPKVYTYPQPTLVYRDGLAYDMTGKTRPRCIVECPPEKLEAVFSAWAAYDAVPEGKVRRDEHRAIWDALAALCAGEDSQP